MIQQNQPTAPFQSASLYVGDLHVDVTEGLLFELFNRVGPVASIRVCRDAVTRRSLGYAYVNFHNVQDAERALDTMNFSDIKGRPDMKGKPCRIMWSQRDPSLRKSGVGNVFVKNLAPTVDNKGLFDTFSVFGNILSCKVATDENGNSKGYGYVHYETAEAAQDAIQKFNGNFIDDHEVFVGPFVRRQERGQANWTNLYVKQFPLSWDESKLCELFQPYGEIASCVISRDADGSSKGFGFLNFVEHESAEKALEELNGKPLGEDGEGSPTELYVNRAQKKGDRTRDIKNRLDALKEERVSKYQGMNLYVKNLDDSITDDFFRETFSKYGTITSARIMRDGPDGTSKGFGFVCYSSSEEATRAVGELNGKIIRNKPIMVTLHQRKDLRRAHLAATYAPRNMRFVPGVGPSGMPVNYMPMYVPQGQANFPAGRGSFGPYATQSFPPRGSPRGLAFAGGRGQPTGPYAAAYQVGPYNQAPPQLNGSGANTAGPQSGANKRVMPGGQWQQPMQGSGLGQNIRNQRQGPSGRGVQQGGRGYMTPGMPPQTMGPAAAAQGRGIKFNNNVRNQGQGMGMGVAQPMMQTSVPSQTGIVSLGEPLDDQALAQADPQMQKNMIGERLYPLIYVHQPGLAGKITGMLLEMDNAELLNLIESPDALMHKIDEALLVLKNHQSGAVSDD